jgi:hypothetical protein
MRRKRPADQGGRSVSWRTCHIQRVDFGYGAELHVSASPPRQSGAKAIFIDDALSVIARVAQGCSTQGYNPIYVTEGTDFTN